MGENRQGRHSKERGRTVSTVESSKWKVERVKAVESGKWKVERKDGKAKDKEKNKNSGK